MSSGPPSAAKVPRHVKELVRWPRAMDEHRRPLTQSAIIIRPIKIQKLPTAIQCQLPGNAVKGEARKKKQSKCVATSPQNCKSASLHCTFKMNLPLDSGEVCRYSCWGGGNKHDTFAADNWPFLTLLQVRIPGSIFLATPQKIASQFTKPHFLLCAVAELSTFLLEVDIHFNYCVPIWFTKSCFLVHLALHPLSIHRAKAESGDVAGLTKSMEGGMCDGLTFLAAMIILRGSFIHKVNLLEKIPCLHFPGLGFFCLMLSSCDYWMMPPLIFPSAIFPPFPKVDLDMKA
ncbi:hypothetical protein D5086_009602 [Populus alba]|uniref:Uncharacterized protein n=1 Tax=Populus alba TaxID=43335 RepID=A0ACC4CIY8_POPAL